MYPKMIRLGFTLVLLGLFLEVRAQNEVIEEGSICQAGDVIGQCVGIREFPKYLSLLGQRKHSDEDIRFLLLHQCGYTSTRKLLACRPVKLNDPGCGRQFSDRIVKGKLAGLDDYPWLALFQYQKPRDETGFHCGGALINIRYVLSAAHCFVGLRSGWKAIKVRLGEWDFEAEQDCIEDAGDLHCAPPVQEFELEAIIPHEDFSIRDLNKQHDIALVCLSRDAIFTNYVKPICIPEADSVSSEQLYSGVLLASGWGKTENASSSRYKLHTQLRAVDYMDCRAAYAKALRIELNTGQICAGGKNSQDTCNGDSGGPLMKEVAVQGRFYLAGVVSFGPRRCGDQLPGVYTAVEEYLPWIARNVLEFT
ncbi:CLIP domain-containing serine protease B4-like [Wyeomyia smithii]|uniref:CLIP domain-containing serine protease B4-like n=1 Tax=Wyeomyia smithii TaxID=174621 RepID=UPI002467B7CE|nr:CLIP domain-containing serine protease B4-like [Wyeomyia smithii]